MDRKKLLFFGFCALFVFSSYASAYVIDRHLIQVNIAEDGSAKVQEKFFLVFRTATELQAFRQNAIKNGSSLEQWGAFDSNISTHFGTIKGGTGRILFEEKQNERFVSLEYETAETVMQKKIETSRKITWEIDSGIFRAFEDGSIYVIPANVDISVLLPRDAALETDTIVPTAVVSGNIVSWSGPINVSGKIVLRYSTEKQIAQTISISKALQDIVSKENIQIIFVSIIVLFALLYWQRKPVNKKIEEYIVDHSKIDSKPGHEDEELE